jgi:transposase
MQFAQAETTFNTPSVRQATFWFLKPPEALTPDQEAFVTQLCTLSPEITEVRTLAHPCVQMLRERQACRLLTWLENAAQSAVTEIRSFARGLRQDAAAVTAALTYEWSNGQVEGQINKLKLLKRQRYGRARLDFLKARLLAVA